MQSQGERLNQHEMRQGTDIKFASPGQQDSVQFICINQVRGVTLFFSCRRYHQPLFVSHVKVSQGTNSGWERLVELGPHPSRLGGAAQPAVRAGHAPSPGSHRRMGWWQDRYQHQRRPSLGLSESAAHTCSRELLTCSRQGLCEGRSFFSQTNSWVEKNL